MSIKAFIRKLLDIRTVEDMSNECWFEPVSLHFRKFPSENIQLPTRGTKYAMAYDVYANKDYEVESGAIAKVWTDVKAHMAKDVALVANVRSSMGGKFMLANTQGWIESDYYSNESNDGNIGIFLKNISNETLTIKKGDRVGQLMFIPFVHADNVYEAIYNLGTTRKGGFGSTNK